MRLLLDTHVLVWAVGQTRFLPAAFKDAIERTENEVFYSGISVLEIAIKSSLGRDDFAFHPDKVIGAAKQIGFRELPVTGAVAARVADLPLHHRDPFDRLLVAQAMAIPATLLTADSVLARYSSLVWLEPRPRGRATV